MSIKIRPFEVTCLSAAIQHGTEEIGSIISSGQAKHRTVTKKSRRMTGSSARSLRISSIIPEANMVKAHIDVSAGHSAPKSTSPWIVFSPVRDPWLTEDKLVSQLN